MWRVGDWAQEWAVEQALGTEASALNDDRHARALDAVAPELERIVGSVGAQAIAAFGIDVARLHWDMTSVSLYGAYEDTDPEHPAPRFGHPKDRRPGPQADPDRVGGRRGGGGVPVFHRAYAGGAGEVAPMFLHNNRRITALITVICLALLIFAWSNARFAGPSLRPPPSTGSEPAARPSPPVG